MNNPKDEFFRPEFNLIFVKHLLFIKGEFESPVSSSKVKPFQKNCSTVEDSLGKQMLMLCKAERIGKVDRWRKKKTSDVSVNEQLLWESH